jgi:curved DNA-binding protein CbpA
MSSTPSEASLDLLHATLARLAENASYYELLGVPRRASTAELQTAFVQLARSLHPDLPALRGEHHAEATRAFQALTRARLVLCDPERRAEYDRTLPQEDILERIEPNPELARIQLHRARQLIQRRDWAGAEWALRQADQLFGEPFDGECRAELGWAIFNNEAHDELNRAEQSRRCFEDAIGAKSSASAVAQAHYYMAIWCKLQGEVPKVKQHLDKCLEINSRHVEAQRELRLFERRRSASTSMPAARDAGRPVPTSTTRRTSGSKRAGSSSAVAAASASDKGKVPLAHKPGLLERLFGKSR